MLSDVEIQKYHEHGYVIPDFRLPEDTLDEIRGAHGRLLQKHPEFRDYCSCLLAYDTGFLNVARSPDILDMVAQLIGPASRSGTRAFSPSRPATASARPGIRTASTGRSGRWRPAPCGSQ